MSTLYKGVLCNTLAGSRLVIPILSQYTSKNLGKYIIPSPFERQIDVIGEVNYLGRFTEELTGISIPSATISFLKTLTASEKEELKESGYSYSLYIREEDISVFVLKNISPQNIVTTEDARSYLDKNDSIAIYEKIKNTVELIKPKNIDIKPLSFASLSERRCHLEREIALTMSGEDTRILKR